MTVCNLLVLSTLQCQIEDILQCSLKLREFQLAVIQVDRGHQNLTAWDLPGIESTAVMLLALPHSPMVYGKEKVDMRRTGYTIFPKDDILFPS